MSEEKKKQKRPLNQKEVEEMLEQGKYFMGKEIGDVDFGKHTFENHVNFRGAKFVGTAKFFDARFLDGANFSKAVFSGDGDADFSYAEFSGDRGVNFFGAIFSGKGGVSFIDAKFSGKGAVYFGSAKFSGEGGADFSYAEFSGKGGVYFDLAEFSGTTKLFFSGAEFLCEDRISFEDVIFQKNCIIFFSGVKVKNPKNLFFRNTYLGNTSFFRTDVEEFNFKNVKFRKFPHDKLNWFKKIISIRREGLIDEIRNDEIRNKDVPLFHQLYSNYIYFWQVEIIYRQLKRNFEEKRDYAKAGDFHYGEMEMKRLQKSKFKQYISLTAFYKYFSGYGQKWTRAFFWFIGFIVLFTFLNLTWLEAIEKTAIEILKNGKLTVVEKYIPPTKFDAILYTFNIMTLRKDARFEIKSSAGTLVVILQSAIGPAILALMLLAIRRQFRR